MNERERERNTAAVNMTIKINSSSSGSNMTIQSGRHTNMTHSHSRRQRRCRRQPSRRSSCGSSLGRTWSFALLLVVAVMSDMTNGGVQGPIEGYNSLDDMTTTYAPTAAFTHPKWMEPYFDPSTPRNVTALMGKSAYLSCRVRNLGNKTVSWIRHRDIHILTVGSYTYTSDQRFQATHHLDTDDWTLQIKWAQKRDAGMYECQISTQPVRSYFVRLNVVVPTATILGGPDLHVDKGSTINLTCTVKFSPEPPAYIFWYHHDEVINYDSSRGGVSVITEKGDVTTSFLLIQNADLADSGKYSCAPSNADVASVRVHVLNGEHPEAMQTGSSGCQYSWLTIVMLVGLVLCYSNQQQRPHQQQQQQQQGQRQQGHVMQNATLTTTASASAQHTTTATTRRSLNSIRQRQRQQQQQRSSTQSSGSGSIMSSKSSNDNNSTTIITTNTNNTTAKWLSSVEVNSCRCQLLNLPADNKHDGGIVAVVSAAAASASVAATAVDPCTRPTAQPSVGCNR